VFRTALSLPRRAALAGLLLAAIGLSARADVRLAALFSDNMVLQRGMPIKIWGWVGDNEPVTVAFRHQKVTLPGGPAGRWTVTLAPEKAGGPDPLIVLGHNSVEVRNVLVGEVWICSGQSNMEFPLAGWGVRPPHSASDIANATNPNLRLFTVPKLKAKEPVEDAKASWQLCTPETVPNFSAVAYYFGQALQSSLHVPVGLIHTSWGGSPVEVWISEDVLRSSPEYLRDLLEPYPGQLRDYQLAVAKWEQAKADAAKAGKQFDQWHPWEPWRPAELYNGMIAPLIPFAVRGAIWYQGESNADRAWQYRHLYPDMIANWRRDWGQNQFAFLAVQLAPWDKGRQRVPELINVRPVESDWAELREAQGVATRVLPQVGLAVITDVGDKDDIHPVQKQPVGERLALAARVIAYGQPIYGLSPTFKSVKFSGRQATVTFDHPGRGLVAHDGKLTGFAVAGADRKFHWADAQICGKNRVVVSSPLVPRPVAVRFGWDDFPIVNLFSRDGLPVSPFRTDDFPMTTAPKR
jgi:sialate O-acetylesterase